MQSWSRQSTKCLFCQFRQSIARSQLRPDNRIHQYREFASTSIRHKDRPRNSNKNDSRPDQNSKSRQSSRGKEFDRDDFQVRKTNRRPAPGNYRPHEEDPELKRAVLKKQVREALVNIQKRLSTQEQESDQNQESQKLSPLQRLDPSGVIWSEFSKHVIAQFEEGSGTGDRALWKKLNAARQPSKADVEQEVYFDFLDLAFRTAGTDPSSGSSLPIDLRYPTEWYSSARSQQREIHLHVGPTNSGKTYNALKRLQESKNGFYAGPLRLLAHEVYSRFRANDIPCDLITGDDVRLDPDLDTKVYASTVEMVRTGAPVEIAVIDEIQMMANSERGWAWTRAFLGANAKEVHLCGESRVVPLIRELSASMGDALHIHHYERLNPLRATTRSLRGNLKLLRKGDCIVAFSIMQIHALKRQIEVETGRRCAIVYGSLPPETRAEQADLFNDPDNDYDYLVASDAIGMGLNLSVKRIIFNSVSKFDGTKRVQLTVPQIKQIAGRAGRYRSAHDDKNKTSSSSKTSSKDESEENVGLVTCLDEGDLPIIQSALKTEAPPIRCAGIVPPAEFLEEYSQRLPIAVPFEYLLRKVSANATLHPRFFQCDMRDKLALARITDDVKGLTIEQRVNLTAAPSPGRVPALAKCLKALARVIAAQKSVDISDVPEIPLETLAQPPTADRSYLEALESLHQCLILFLWLSYRFITNLRDKDMALHAKAITEQKINWTLRAFSANPKLRERLRSIRRKQQNLVDEHFNTEMPSEGEDETDSKQAQPDRPAEAYTDDDASEGENEKGYEGLKDLVPEMQDFEAGDEGLDLGNQFDASSTQGRTGPLPDSESNLDIAPPMQQRDETPVQQSLGLPQNEFAEPTTHETLVTPSEGQVIDQQLENIDELIADPADPKPQQQSDGKISTAKGLHGEFVDPNALRDEIEEGEKLRGSAGG